MQMAVAEFDQRLNRYVQTVLIPECKVPLRKFMLGALVGTGRLSVKIVPQDMLAALGVLKGDAVDTDVLRKAALGGVEAAGELYVGVLGLHFTKADLEKFFTFVEKGVLV